MKDIDFDELDRAVSSLMNDVPKTDPVKNDDVRTLTLAADNQEEDNDAPEVSVDPVSIAEVAAAPDRPTPSVSATPVMPAARRGRFMDMVRPPVRETRKQLAPSTVSRNGTTLEPVTSRPLVVGNPIRTESTKPNDSTAPTDLSSVSNDFEQAPSGPESEDVNTTLGTAEASLSRPISEQPPIVSPFLPDAKVEKRPLGRTSDTTEYAISSENTATDNEISVAPAGIVDDNLSQNPDAQLPEQPLPAELDSKLLDIETSTASLPNDLSDASSATEKPASRTGLSASGAPKPLTATSIPQQYKVQPKVSDVSASGTIYDTASYHQPLAHPPKKKPGWLWVVAIIAILILGAACGAVAYYLGLV